MDISVNGGFYKDKVEFWTAYLNFLNIAIEEKHQLKDAEIRIMAYVLSQNPDKNQFRGTNRINMRMYLGDLADTYLSSFKKKLVDKGWLRYHDDGGVFVVDKLRKLQRLVYNDNAVTINFSLKFNVESNIEING